MHCPRATEAGLLPSGALCPASSWALPGHPLLLATPGWPLGPGAKSATVLSWGQPQGGSLWPAPTGLSAHRGDCLEGGRLCPSWDHCVQHYLHRVWLTQPESPDPLRRPEPNLSSLFDREFQEFPPKKVGSRQTIEGRVNAQERWWRHRFFSSRAHVGESSLPSGKKLWLNKHNVKFIILSI